METLAGFRSVCVVDMMRLMVVVDDGDDDDGFYCLFSCDFEIENALSIPNYFVLF